MPIQLTALVEASFEAEIKTFGKSRTKAMNRTTL